MVPICTYESSRWLLHIFRPGFNHQKWGGVRSKPRHLRKEKLAPAWVLGPEDRSNIESSIPNNVEIESIGPKTTLVTLSLGPIVGRPRRKCLRWGLTDAASTRRGRKQTRHIPCLNVCSVESDVCFATLLVNARLGASPYESWSAYSRQRIFRGA